MCKPVCNSCNMLQCPVCRPPVCHVSCRPSVRIGRLLTWVTPVFLLVCVALETRHVCKVLGIVLANTRMYIYIYIYTLFNNTTNSCFTQRTTTLNQQFETQMQNQLIKSFFSNETQRETQSCRLFCLKVFLFAAVETRRRRSGSWGIRFPHSAP